MQENQTGVVIELKITSELAEIPPWKQCTWRKVEKKERKEELVGR